MKKLKNVLYVTSPGCTLSVKNRSICVTTDEGSQNVPVHNLESVVCFGDMKVSTPFMQFCSNNGVKLVFLSCYGRYYGTFNGLQTGSVFLRREQYKRFDDPDIRLSIAGDIISAKIRNSVRVLMKNTHSNDRVKTVIEEMMEEFRAPLCDRFVLSLINRKQVTKDDFTKDDDGNIILSDKCRRTVISEWQTRKKTEVYVEEVNEKIEIGLIPFVQAMMISEYLRNERESYKPFIWR